MTTKVTFVCQWYPPEPMAVPESIAHSLAHKGLRVEVLTGIPNYPSGVVEQGYRSWRATRGMQDGLKVNRTPLYPSHDLSALKRLLNYASWALSSMLLGQGPLRKSGANLVYSSPATAAFPAMVAKALWGTPYVLLIQDVWPDSIFASGFLAGRTSRLVSRAVDVFVRRSYAMADHIAVISPGMAGLLSERGVPRDKMSVVYNWLPEGDVADDDDISCSLRADVGVPDDAKLFLYAGNHGRAQALEALVDAFLDPGTAPAHLVLLGDGVSKADLVKRGAGQSRIHFLDPVSRLEAARMSRAADVHVVSLADEPLFAVTMPSKLQSGLAAGRPVLAVTPGDSATLVSARRAGLTALPGNAASVAQAVIEFNALSRDALAAMGERGRRAYEQLMTRDIGATRLAELLAQAAARRAGTASSIARSMGNEEGNP